MDIYTGNPDLDLKLSRSGARFLILYGEPGAGKSNLALKISRETILNRGIYVYYISTEGDLIVERMFQLKMPSDKIYFANVKTLPELLKAIMHLVDKGASELVIVDSVNSLYRVEAMFSERANQIFLAILAFLKLISDRGTSVIATAQIRETGDSIEPSALKLIRFYTDLFGRVSRSRGGCRVLEILGDKYLFKVTEDGLKWLSSIDFC